MVVMRWRSTYEGEIKTLKLKENPFKHGLGYYEDIDGKTWDVVCIVGGDKPYVNARLVTNIPYYGTSTFDCSNGLHIWNPYFFEVIEEKIEV